jgi:hypothetical protein
MKRVFTFLAVLAFIILTGGAAVPQTGQVSQSFNADQLFTEPLGTDLRPEAADTLKDVVKRAQQGGGQCPVEVDVTVLGFSASEERLFVAALAAARTDAVKAVLESLGPAVTVSGKSNVALANIVSVSAKTGNRDNEPPSLSVTWTPPKGSIVKAGDRIKVDAAARDDANRFQTGVAESEFLVLPQNQLFGFHQWPKRPMRCEDVPPAHHTSQDYVVPNNPPSVVRLAVRAKDFAGHDVYQLAEFPTGKWQGRIETHIKGSVYNDRAIIEFAVEEAPDGAITGRGQVTLASRPIDDGNCTWTRTITPNAFDVAITGSHEGDNLRIDLSREGRSNWQFTSQCRRGGGSGSGPPASQPYNALASFHAIMPHIRVPAREGATNRVEVTHGNLTSDATVTIHRAAQ